ncbi:MAG: OmpA family protein [Leptospiraceae bacterium]|nr:OmpA family protein [Leptospiraceae bacterium]
MLKFIVLLALLVLPLEIIAQKIPLSENVNSRYDELAPVLSPDGKTLYLCREGHPQNTGFDKRRDDQDIWVSRRTENGDWTKAERLDAKFNSPLYDFPIGVSGDGSILYIGNKYADDGVVSPGVSRSRLIREKWGKPEGLKIIDYYNNAGLVNYYMAPDERTLLLNLKRDDTYGKMDLYISLQEEDGSWSAPLNLGNTINSGYNEVTPFIASDLKTLYFASDRPGGMGGFDMYFAQRLDDSWRNWSEPVNMGDTINSQGNDISYIIDPSGEYAIFSSDTKDNGKDLFRVPLPKKFRPETALLVSGTIKDLAGKPLSARIYYERLRDGVKAGQTESNVDTGEFKFTLPKGEKYGLHAELDGYLSISKTIDNTKNTGSTSMNVDLTMSPISQGTKINLNNIFFSLGSHTLTKESHAELKRLAKILQKNPKMKVEVGGHTDSQGAEKSNRLLSQRRAESVRKFLIEQGASAGQISAKGYGASTPVASNSTAAGRQANRRVEFTILDL